MSGCVVFGAAYSVYVRIARLALEEKRVPYRLEEIDVFAEGGPPANYLARHPFGRIPAFEHDGFGLYETAAIARYVDEAFDGPALQPHEAKARARMNQIVSILDNYAYPALVWDIFVERVRAPATNRKADETRIAAALPKARRVLGALGDLADEGQWLCGGMLTLADLYAAPMICYFRMAREGREMLAEFPRLEGWWRRMAARPSVAATRSPFEA